MSEKVVDLVLVNFYIDNYFVVKFAQPFCVSFVIVNQSLLFPSSKISR
jgi:hypothetical protein